MLTRDGRILAASYEGEEAGLKVAIFFQGRDGRGEFYSPDGHSLEKFFLRAPLSYRRVSSHFTRRRFHPILRRFRAHLGIDYAAPWGTPVVSVGDGTVEFAGWDTKGMRCR
jgi:murein DD-endopeptidase MepM/ murein hydrolase activator NlpD